MAIQIWQPGDKIKNDRFHILKQLGKGGFGITYLAEDTIKKQQVVIKTLNANQQGEADFAQKQENFVKEGFTLRTFNHPHIVKVYEPIQIGNLWGLVMEYIPGQDLADYLIANGRLGEAEALNYIDQIAQALDCVHQQKFFHRDVHPGNIVLRQDRGEAVLIDFGIAREFVDLTTIYLSNTHGRDIYKPIEQYEKRGRFGAYTDIYSLSVTFYHLLTGQPPLSTARWRRDNRHTKFAIDGENFLLKKLADIGVSDSVQTAIHAGMGIEPNERPQTITDFRELLGFVTTSKIITSQLTDEIVIFDSDINLLNDEKDNNTLDTCDFDFDPFAGLSDLNEYEYIDVPQTIAGKKHRVCYVTDNAPTTTAIGALAKKIDREGDLRLGLELSAEEAIYGMKKEIKVQRLRTCHSCQKHDFLQIITGKCYTCKGEKRA